MAGQAKSWVVDFDSDAVIDFEDVKSRGDRKAVFNAVQKLKDVGRSLPSPHMKSLKGSADLFELRPKQEPARFARSTPGSGSASSCWRLRRRRRTSIERLRMRKAASAATDVLLAEEQLADPSFKAEWQRLAPAREFAATLLRYRAEHKLSQRALATKLGVSQPRVVKLESGEHNPEVDTIINAVRRLGIEFVLDVAPTSRKPSLVTARARKRGAIDHDEVSVVVAASA